jgi:hypothetical protein
VPERTVTVTDDLSRIKYELELFMLGGAFDLREGELFIATVEPSHVSAEVSYGKLILYCWGEGWSRSWRVINCEATRERLRLACTRQMGRARCLIDLTRGPRAIDSIASRAEFATKLASMIESRFPGLRVERAVAARYDPQHLSGVHTRLIIKERGRTIAGIGVGAGESQASIDAVLAAGIIWLDALRRKNVSHKNVSRTNPRRLNASINRLMIFAPRDRALTIATRLTAVGAAGAGISLYEVGEAENVIEPVAAFDQGDLGDRLRKAAARAHWPRERALAPEITSLIDSVRGLSPDLIEAHERERSVLLSIKGLEFARVPTARRQIEFGTGEVKERLDRNNQSRLEELVSEISLKRDAASDYRNDPLFRAQSERWLESIIRRDVSVIDASLDSRYVYSQVPAYRGEQRSFIDLLTVTREGRLVVIELKVAEDAEFPFQGLDYWLRVEWHRLRGDFLRRGYFQGVRLADAVPLLYLVAPLFRFHAATGLIASSIANRVPVYRIGINEDWRAGVSVLLSERLN